MDGLISIDPAVITRRINNFLELTDDPFEDYPNVEFPDHVKEFFKGLPAQKLTIEPTVTDLLKTMRDIPEILSKIKLVKHFPLNCFSILARLDRIMVIEPKEQILSNENDHIDTQTSDVLIALCQKYNTIYLCLDMRTNSDARAELEARGMEF
jgi:hypothetical protein